MSQTTALGFFTPIRFDYKHANLIDKLLISTEELFYLRGKVAYIQPCECGPSQHGVRLEDGEPSLWKTALKVMFFVYPLVWYKGLLPTLHHNRVAALLKAAPVITLLCMAAVKIISRTFIKFHVCNTSSRYNDVEVPADLIDPQVKLTLNALIGQLGLVDELPVYNAGEPITADKMTHPLMKGIRKGRFEKTPFIAIKMKCLSADTVGAQVAILTQTNPAIPPAWNQSLLDKTANPQFFLEDICFTDEQGKVVQDQLKGFQLLQKIIKEGRGYDLRSFWWEIIDHPKLKNE